jgi:ketosteroid isomerase-like protein
MIEGFGTSDLLALLGEMDPEVGLEIHAPVLFPWIRRAKGIDQVRAAVLHNFSTVEAQQTKVLAVVAQGHVVDVTLQETGRIRATQQPYEVVGVQQFVFRDGKVLEFREFVAHWTPEE